MAFLVMLVIVNCLSWHSPLGICLSCHGLLASLLCLPCHGALGICLSCRGLLASLLCLSWHDPLGYGTPSVMLFVQNDGTPQSHFLSWNIKCIDDPILTFHHYELLSIISIVKGVPLKMEIIHDNCHPKGGGSSLPFVFGQKMLF